MQIRDPASLSLCCKDALVANRCRVIHQNVWENTLQQTCCCCWSVFIRDPASLSLCCKDTLVAYSTILIGVVLYIKMYGKTLYNKHLAVVGQFSYVTQPLSPSVVKIH